MCLGRLTILLLIALSVFSSIRYFVTVCRLQSMIWYPKELLASSFIVSATTLEFGFSSPCRRASTADCTKLSKQSLGVYWTNRWIFLLTRPSCKKNKSKGVIMVPFLRIKLDMSNLLGWIIIFSYSAYCFVRLPISSLLTTVFLNMVVKLEK